MTFSINRVRGSNWLPQAVQLRLSPIIPELSSKQYAAGIRTVNSNSKPHAY